jgi:hypothetical protein
MSQGHGGRMQTVTWKVASTFTNNGGVTPSCTPRWLHRVLCTAWYRKIHMPVRSRYLVKRLHVLRTYSLCSPGCAADRLAEDGLWGIPIEPNAKAKSESGALSLTVPFSMCRKPPPSPLGHSQVGWQSCGFEPCGGCSKLAQRSTKQSTSVWTVDPF